LDTGTSLEYRIPDPRFGWVLKPGASYIYRIAEEAVPVNYNAEGWRDLPHAQEKAEGVVRVLVLGDSFMEAYSVRFEDSLPARLEHLTSTAERRVEVINLGVGGYGTLQEYLVFDAVGRAYRPDVVVLAMYLSNDLEDNSQELAVTDQRNWLKTKARPFLDPRVREPSWRGTPVDFEGTLRRYEEHMRLQAELLNRLLRNSALLQLGQRALGRKLWPIWWKGSRSKEGVSLDKKHLTKFGKYYCSQPPEYDRAWGVTGRILTRLNREVRATGASLLVMSVPAIGEVDEDVMAQLVRHAPQPLCLGQAPAYRRLGELLRELDIDYLDLLPAFRDARQQTGVELFRRSDQHWNPQGHALAARELAAALEHRGYLVSPVAGFSGDKGEAPLR
jgi:lysophospholipase L1-like esterase